MKQKQLLQFAYSHSIYQPFIYLIDWVTTDHLVK